MTLSKKIPVFILLTVFLMSSCSKDDPAQTNNELDLAAGTYQLVEVNINPAQDINNDGTTTTNVVSELPCATGTLNLRTDANWTWSFENLNVTAITGGQYKIACTSTSNSRSGSWKIASGQITLFDGANTYIFVKNDTRLTYATNIDLPGFRSVVYERQ